MIHQNNRNDESATVTAADAKAAVLGSKEATAGDYSSWSTPSLGPVADPDSIRSLVDAIDNMAGGPKGTLSVRSFLSLATQFYMDAVKERVEQLEQVFVGAEFSEHLTFPEFCETIQVVTQPEKIQNKLYVRAHACL